ncbi:MULTISPECIES: FAD-dependent oxidoreductase [unclassified Vibrio]|uniref:FAD-dependent oxidoreductase n=1 Tax=unclassified Vibrio TaxID=2614977 RepID=UPI0025521469|nr:MULTISPECIES: FAD-dependent oxidoreductase [unclassified Vibrio]MDK9778757.1 FAD-dependent oxidoreductase [Vibrio sp. D401a]MDK9808664.1 FAD-dependent oxidoreductase [Vibrio sp. D406a]
MTHPSYWFKQALEIEQPETAKPLQQNIQADVAIVGGGYTGLWTAIMIKQQSPEKQVVVIEKGLCGSGASGANGGCMLTWSTKFPTLKRLFGEEHAAWLVKESEQAVLEIDDFCQQHHIDAQLSLKGVYYTATNHAQTGGMQPVVDELKRLEVNSWRHCQTEELRANAGSPRNIEGYHSPVAASVQPALLARGLRRVAMELGVEIYENTPMTRLDYGKPATVCTPTGNVQAQQVVLALNAWMVEQFKQFKSSIVVVSSDMVITKPLGDALTQSGWQAGSSVLDSRIFVHYYRDTPDGRLMLGKGGNQFSFNNQVNAMFNKPTRYQELLRKSFDKLFPRLKGAEFAYSWTGGSDRSATGFPFFGELDNQSNIFYGFGYSGNGVAQTRMGGKILSSLVLGIENEWTKSGLAKGPLGHFPPEPFRWTGAMMVRNAVRRKEEAEDNEQKPFIWDKWLAKLAGPAGKADKLD